VLEASLVVQVIVAPDVVMPELAMALKVGGVESPKVTVNLPTPVPTDWSVFITEMSRTPVVAEPAIVTFAVIEVQFATVALFTVMPVPLKETTAPLRKFVPVRVKDRLEVFWEAEAGEAKVTVGFAIPLSSLENAALRFPAWS
jgi:hypothetical protein